MTPGLSFVDSTSTNRITALQSGDIDLLARGVTWTQSAMDELSPNPLCSFPRELS